MKWISVNDKLPKPWRKGSVMSKEVFVSFVENDIRRYGSGSISLKDLTSWQSGYLHKVTHWMNIPPLLIK